MSVDYSTARISELVEGTDYTVTDATGLVTITNDCLEGNVTMRYWAEHWESIVHDARDKYGTALDPVSQQNSTNGWSYACFADVTSLVKGDTSYDYTIASGNGEYAVRAIDATTGDEAAYDSGQNWPQWCYSGWSLIVLYESFTETAHQFYLYDPIHNSGDCPFYVDNEEGAEFTLSDFYPPEGSVEGTLTYFIGEGDDLYNDDYIQFKGVSQPAFENPTIDNTLSGPNNPWNDVINGISTTGEVGVDVDTFDIVEDVGSDTEANVRFKNKYDSWNLTYVILSFKTSMMPKEDFLFNVSAVTYKYELGTNK